MHLATHVGRDGARLTESLPMNSAMRQVRPRHLVVCVLLALPLAVFFAPTLIAGNAPGAFDLSYQSSPWRDEVTRPLDAQSPVQIDQAEQLPWVDGMWESLREGRIPMWTPAVGGGTSLGTNPVFTTYSVFTIVGQLVGSVTSLAIGLAVRILLATAVAELFGYLFLRRMKLSVGASVFGTVAYVFSGAAVAFETRNAIPLLLPVVLWCTDRLAERVTPGRIVALAGTVLALWLEGFPAMLVHALVVAALWWVVRVAIDNGLVFWRRPALGQWVRQAAAFGGSVGLGFLLSAVSAVPFALQLGYNDVFAARSDEATPLGRISAWWLLDERALGVPDRGPWYIGLNPFEGVSAVGTLVMVVALAGVLVSAFGRRGADRRQRDSVRNTWAVLVAVLAIAVFMGGPLLDALYALPGFSGNPFSRIRYVIAFGLAVLAAIGIDEVEGWWRERSGEPVTRRWPHVVVALGFVACLGLPFVASLGEYLDVLRGVRDLAVTTWRSELIVLGVGVAVLGVLVVTTRRLPERWTVGRSLALGGVAAAIAFTQVGLQITRLTPQVDREFYYPETNGYDALRAVAGHDLRFIGSGMGTFAPNTAMTNDVVDARSHSFRDPQWKTLILSVFPDALGPDPLKINVDFHGNVDWDSPVFDDLAIGVVAMSSSEVPLGDRHDVPAAQSWTPVRGVSAVDSDAPDGGYVGLEFRLRTSGNCGQGDVVVTATPDGGPAAVSRRPLGDARAAGVANAPLPFALPMDDAVRSEMSVRLDGAPADCVLEVGATDDSETVPAVAPITRPVDAPWQMASADGGWLYTRSSAHPLVRTVADWTPLADRSDALEAAVDPSRTSATPMPVATATDVPDGATAGTVESWSADDHGISAEVSSDGPTLLATSFNQAPGWTATVDGEAAKIVEPDGAFLGVQLPAGRHEVRFEYAPPGLKAGAALTLFGLVACTVVLLWPRWWPVVSPRLRRRDRSRRRGAAEPGDEAAGSTGTPAAAAPD